MEKFTGWQYLLIDCANHYGLDKKLFSERIQWCMDNLDTLEHHVEDADSKPLYMKAVMAIRKAQAKIPTGHLVGMDACCSGIQVMSAMTGCVVGATSTGLVDPNVRADAYNRTTEVMQQTLGNQFMVDRKDAKQALMTSFYGSKAEPKNLFGEDTPELNAFYDAMIKVAPGAWELLQDLLGSWQSYSLCHSWTLPDGFQARVKVMDKKEVRIEVDELNHATFTYEFYENQGKKSGLSNVANVVHSVDAYVLRSMHRRCNYSKHAVISAKEWIEKALNFRGMMRCEHNMGAHKETMADHFVKLWMRTGMPDVVILTYIGEEEVRYIPSKLLRQLLIIIDSMLVHHPFSLITVHDEFKSHANNMNYVRQHYINIFAEIAESNILSDILSQIHGFPGTFKKLSNNLGDLIRNSNYALS